MTIPRWKHYHFSRIHTTKHIIDAAYINNNINSLFDKNSTCRKKHLLRYSNKNALVGKGLKSQIPLNKLKIK